MGDRLRHLRGNAVRLVADNDNIPLLELKFVDAHSVKECAEDASVARLLEEGDELASVYTNMRERAHRGLDDLRVVEFHAVGRADDVADAEPVGGAHDSAEVAGIGDVVEDEQRLAVGNVLHFRTLPRDGEQLRRGLHRADARHLVSGDEGGGEVR